MEQPVLSISILVSGKYDNVKIYNNAKICRAIIFDNAKIYGNTKINDNNEIKGKVVIEDRAEICDNTRIYGNILIGYNTKFFKDTIIYGIV